MTKSLLPLIMLLSLFCSGCIANFKKIHSGIDPAFEPYVSEIIEKSDGGLNKNMLKGLSIGFEKKDPPEVGICRVMTFEIGISKEHWAVVSEAGKLELVAHELGHCVLGRYHTNSKGSYLHDIPVKLGLIANTGYLNDFCPSSIMHPMSITEYCLIRHKKYYMMELFGKTDKLKYQGHIWDYVDEDL